MPIAPPKRPGKGNTQLPARNGSAEEQRRLDAIEQSLREDPRFIARATDEGRRRRRLMLAGAVLTLGAGLVVIGLAATQIQLTLGVITCIAGLLTLAAAVVIGLHGQTPPRG